MTEMDLLYAIGDLDEEILRESESFGAKQRKQPLKPILAAAACLLLTLSVTVLIKNGSAFPSRQITDVKPTDSTDATYGAAGNTEPMTTVQTLTTSGVTSGVSTTAAVDPSTEDGSGSYAGFFRPAVPKDRTVVAKGERLTDEEASAYLAENRESLLSSLTAMGVDATDARICPRGYSHVSYNGTEGETLTVQEDFRDYLVTKDETVIAIVTLVKENGKIWSSPSFGAAWFAPLSDFLKAHPGEELLYVYSGTTELILTPDNEVYATALSPSGYDADAYFEGITDPYSVFYHPSAVFVLLLPL